MSNSRYQAQRNGVYRNGLCVATFWGADGDGEAMAVKVAVLLDKAELDEASEKVGADFEKLVSTAATPTDWTPDRIKELRSMCHRIEGLVRSNQPEDQIRDDMAGVAFVVIGQVPTALDEIERLQAETARVADLFHKAAGEAVELERERDRLRESMMQLYDEKFRHENRAPISIRPERCGGEPCISGTRLTVAAVQSFKTVERALVAYPHITAKQAAAALAYSLPKRRRTKSGS